MSELPSRASGSNSEAPAARPIRVVDLELSQPLPSLPALDAATGRSYERAQVLVRLHRQPLGMLDLDLGEEGLSAADLADRVWLALHGEINDHLREDGLATIHYLDSAGLPTPGGPPCETARKLFLASAPFASVILCTRNRVDHLATSLPVLLTLEYPQYEIIVVDNAPRTSATADFVSQGYGHVSRVRYVREDRPGLSWARNLGLQHAQGEIVAYVDDDELADRLWLARLVEGFQATDGAACVTGLMVARELETQAQVWFEEFGGFRKGRGFTRRLYNLTMHRPPDPLYPYLASLFGTGGNMAFKTSVLRDLGGFDPALGAGTPSGSGEEFDVFFRLIMAGGTLVWEPAALIRHCHRRDYDGLRRQLRAYGTGYAAYLTKCLADDPRRLLFFLSRIPSVLTYLLSPRSPRNESKRSGFPAELTRAELSGMLVGPFAYLLSRWHSHQIARKSERLAARASSSHT